MRKVVGFIRLSGLNLWFSGYFSLTKNLFPEYILSKLVSKIVSLKKLFPQRFIKKLFSDQFSQRSILSKLVSKIVSVKKRFPG